MRNIFKYGVIIQSTPGKAHVQMYPTKMGKLFNKLAAKIKRKPIKPATTHTFYKTIYNSDKKTPEEIYYILDLEIQTLSAAHPGHMLKEWGMPVYYKDGSMRYEIFFMKEPSK